MFEIFKNWSFIGGTIYHRHGTKQEGNMSLCVRSDDQGNKVLRYLRKLIKAKQFIIYFLNIGHNSEALQ